MSNQSTDWTFVSAEIMKFTSWKITFQIFFNKSIFSMTGAGQYFLIYSISFVSKTFRIFVADNQPNQKTG